jgi:hypothetical protein
LAVAGQSTILNPGTGWCPLGTEGKRSQLRMTVSFQDVVHHIEARDMPGQSLVHRLGYLRLWIAGAEFQGSDELPGGGPILVTFPQGTQVAVKDRRPVPVTDGLGVRESLNPLQEKGQIMQWVKDVLLPAIGAAMYRHCLPPGGYLHAIHEGL